MSTTSGKEQKTVNRIQEKTQGVVIWSFGHLVKIENGCCQNRHYI
jgi:hypothetical protein